MNSIAREKKLAILAALVDGNSERGIHERGVANRLTVSRYALRFGRGASNLHNALVHGLSCSIVQLDEIWSYVRKKQRRVATGDPPEYGDQFTYVALDTSSRLVVSFLVGKRNEENTKAFAGDVASRLVVMPSLITSDGFAAYSAAIRAAFGESIDYAQLIKDFHRSPSYRDDDHRYEPPRNPYVTKVPVFGAPDLSKVSTSYVERHNGTMRMKIGRIRRLSYAFSKNVEHHRAAVALNYVHYNFCHVVRTLRVTPAMQAGITDHVWGIEEFFDRIMTAADCAPPVAKPLAHRTPDTTHRELPGRRGFLRVVPRDGRAAPPATSSPRTEGADDKPKPEP